MKVALLVATMCFYRIRYKQTHRELILVSISRTNYLSNPRKERNHYEIENLKLNSTNAVVLSVFSANQTSPTTLRTG